MAVATSIALAAGACGDDEPSGAQSADERLIEIYSATVTEVAAEAPDGTADHEDDEKKLTVFLQARDEADITAEVQVGVVNDLDDWANVRFIDDIEEAVDGGSDGAPVRDEGLLIGLGSVSEGDVSASLTADRYVSDAETVVYEVSVRRRSGEWTVEEPLQGVSVRNP